MDAKNVFRRCALCFLMMLLLMSTGCGKKEELSEVTVTYVKSPLNVPSMVEKNQGIFSKHFAELGIKVNYAEITSGSEQVQALESGDVHFLYCVGATSVIIGKSNGADIQVLNVYGSSPGAYQMFTGASAIQNAQDLKGKRIGGPKGTTLHELLSAYLVQNAMCLDDVEYVTLSVADAFAALEAGQIDAAMLAGVTAYQAQQAGYRCLTTGEGLTNGTTLVATSQAFAEAHPEVVEAFCAAQQEIMDFIRDYPEKTRTIVEAETGLAADAIDAMYPVYSFYTEPTQKDREGLEQTARFLLDVGMIETIPEIELK